MAEKLLQNQKLFCEIPSSKHAKREAKTKWKTLVLTESAAKAVRFAQKPHKQFSALKSFYGSSAVELFSLLSGDLAKFKRLIELVQKDVGHWRLKMMGMLVSVSPEIMLTEVFEGIVTSKTDNHVTIEFKLGDDLDVRQFSWDDFDIIYKGVLDEGQVVRARCQLELISPREPMSDNEIEKWKRQYRDVRGYLKKAKRGRNLLEEDDE